jgi:hypothetical protein
MKLDGYSGFEFFQALAPQDVAAGSTTGATVDTQGYDTVTIVVNVGTATGGGALSVDNRFQLMLEHYNSAGVSAWSECYPSQILHSVVGEAGAYSTLNSGIFQSIESITSFANLAYAVGYKGPQRFIRLRISDVGAPSTYSMGAIAILGKPANWPVNNVIG